MINTITKVINFLPKGKRKPSYLMLIRLMNNNILLSSALYTIFCYCTNLRVLNDCPNIELIINSRASIWPFNKFGKIWISNRINVIKISDRIKYKGIRHFSFYRSFKLWAFSRNFDRKTTIDVQSKLRYSIEQNSFLEKELWAFYRNPNTKNVNKISKWV